MDRSELHDYISKLFQQSKCRPQTPSRVDMRADYEGLRRYFSQDLRPTRHDRVRWFDSIRACFPPWFELALNVYWRGDVLKSRPERILLERLYEILSIFIGASQFTQGAPAEKELTKQAEEVEAGLCELLEVLYNPSKLNKTLWKSTNVVDSLIGTTDTSELLDKIWSHD